MTDSMEDSIEEIEQRFEREKDKKFVEATPATERQYEKIDEDLKARHAYAEQAAKEHAKEALEELYANEFPINDPPDSYERYEAELTLRYMRASIKDSFNNPDRHEFRFVIDASEEEITEVPEFVEEQRQAGAVWDELVEEAKQRIDVMATYGSLAESHIAALTTVDHADVRTYATETLAEMRREEDESKSLTAALRDWWHGPDDRGGSR